MWFEDVRIKDLTNNYYCYVEECERRISIKANYCCLSQIVNGGIQYLGNIVISWSSIKREQVSYLTYLIGHYNPSVRIIDIVSHTPYVVCVNFIHKWRDLQFKVDFERQIF